MKHLAFLLAFVCLLVAEQLPAQGPPKTEVESGYTRGETQWLGDGVIYSWVFVDPAGKPSALGVTFTDGLLNNLPEQSVEVPVKLPEVVAHPPFTHFTLNWQPKGHMPEQFYGAPHFDFHFYTITPQAQAAITGTGDDQARILKQPPAQFIPEGYVPAAPGVARMGLHWICPDFHEFHGQAFTESFLFGSYNGNVIFYEPMITRAFLLTRPLNVNKPISQAAAVREAGYYPTRYTIAYDAARKQTTVALEGLVYRHPTPR